MATFQFHYKQFASAAELNDTHRLLLTTAQEATKHAYAPYSHFKVGAAVLLHDGKIITGVNVENASYPVGICAERSALAAVISNYPNEEIMALAISYEAPSGDNNKPAFPCGMCRQFISECEDRNKKNITLILGAMQGEVMVIETAKHLLPFSFGGSDLG
ncbi:MAG TPA: cytidine deaminase [Chitinophagaceae bacterium]|nr:cytidine deaminase [Chitinophagaceae bacterium]